MSSLAMHDKTLEDKVDLDGGEAVTHVFSADASGNEKAGGFNDATTGGMALVEDERINRSATSVKPPTSGRRSPT